MLYFNYNKDNIFYISIHVNAGVIHESEKVLGISHMLEHMMFKNTTKYTGKEVLKRATKIGSIFNAGTDKDSTYYYFKTTSDKYKNAIELMSQMILHPVFTKEDLDSERKVVIEELLSGIDNDDKQLWTVYSWQSILSSESKYTRKVIGTIETLKSITIEDLYEYHKMFYNNFLIYINCSRNMKTDITEYLLKCFHKETFDNYKRNDVNTSQYIKLHRKVIVRNRLFNQNSLYLTFPICHKNLTLKELMTIELLNFILTGAGLYSILMIELREKQNLIYSVESHFEPMKHINLFRIILSTSSNDIISILNTIFNILGNIVQKNDAFDFKFYKESFYKKMELALSSLSFTCSLVPILLFNSQIESITDDKILTEIKKIKFRDLIKQISTILQKDNCGVVWSSDINGDIQEKAETIMKWMYIKRQEL